MPFFIVNASNTKMIEHAHFLTRCRAGVKSEAKNGHNPNNSDLKKTESDLHKFTVFGMHAKIDT